MPVRIGDLCVVFISYDGLRAEAHWRDLLTKCPRAERVHGVRGISGAFRRAAAVAATERFITVDGDTVVDAAFFEHALDEDELTSGAVFVGRSAMRPSGARPAGPTGADAVAVGRRVTGVGERRAAASGAYPVYTPQGGRRDSASRVRLVAARDRRCANRFASESGSWLQSSGGRLAGLVRCAAAPSLYALPLRARDRRRDEG